MLRYSLCILQGVFYEITINALDEYFVFELKQLLRMRDFTLDTFLFHLRVSQPS